MVETVEAECYSSEELVCTVAGTEERAAAVAWAAGLRTTESVGFATDRVELAFAEVWRG